MANQSIDNSSSLFSSRVRRHTSFVSPNTLLQPCTAFYTLQDVCGFVNSTEGCKKLAFHIDYLKILLCDLNISKTKPYQLIMVPFILLFLIFYVTFVIVVGKYFMVPNIINVARHIKLPAFEFGVSVVGFFIALPDFIFAISSCRRYTGNGTLLISKMMGRALGAFSIGMASIAFCQYECKFQGVHIFRTVILMTTANSVVAWMLHLKNVIDYTPRVQKFNFKIQYPASALLFFYCFFVFYTLISKRRPSNFPWHEYTDKIKPDPVTRRGWKLFKYPFDVFTYIPKSQLIAAVVLPFWIVATLLVPVVDVRRPLNGWSKYLFCINIMLIPWVLRMEGLENDVLGALNGMIGICCIVTLGFLIFSKNYQPPRYHSLISFLGILMGSSLLHLIDIEVGVLLLQTMSFLFHTPADVTSIHSFSICYSIISVIFGVTFMKINHANLASGTVLGIAMSQSFYMLPVTVFRICYDWTTQLIITSHTLTCYIFSVIIPISAAFSIILSNYHLRYIHGAFIISLYIVFITFSILAAMDLIHPYGALHTIVKISQISHKDWA